MAATVRTELKAWPRPAPDYVAENRALAALAQELASHPIGVFPKVAEFARELCHADSAAVGVLEYEGIHEVFRWLTSTGAVVSDLVGVMPRDASPCGGAVASHSVVRLQAAERFFPAWQGVGPRIYDGLFAPWQVDGQPAGCLCVVKHTPDGRFTAEDARLLATLAPFASAAQQSLSTIRSAQDTRQARLVEERARALWQDDQTGLRKLYELHARLANENDLYAALNEILAAACEFTDTDRGCVQLVSDDGERLEIVVSSGYAPGARWVEHFRKAGSKPACDAARRHRQRLIIEDVATFAPLAGTLDREVALEAEVRACQSTPMISRKGNLVGVLSTQFRQPHRSAEHELRLIDLLAWTAAEVVERHLAEATLRESEEERFRALVRASSDVLYRMSPDWAEMRQLGGGGFISDTESPTRDWLQDYIHPDDQPPVRKAIKEAIRTKSLFELEHRVWRVDGTLGWTLSRAVPILDAQGEITEWIGAATDITERKASELEIRRQNEELTKANRELEEFAYVSHHDLQEPIRTVNIYAQQLLRRFVPDEPEAQECAGYIRQGVSRMQELIQDLLHYSRVVHVDGLPASGTADLSTAVNEVLSVLGNSIEESHARIIVGPLPSVRGDTRPLAQVFQNLLSNALKYRKSDVLPEIRISAVKAEGHCVITVEDNGIGFEPQYAERIFGLFKRLHKDEYPGTGLGLAICQRIVERYGGRIWGQGRPGEGAKFCFVLPSADV